MSLKKTVAIAAAAGALAAISVPAMAFENEFHGSYTFNAIFSNFQDGGSGDFNPAAATYGDKRKTNNYFEQRGRLQYIAKASDDLKLVTQFELDTRFGGITDNKYTNSSDAGVLDSDGINLETKHIYLDFNLGNSFNVKTGVMPYKDTLKGLFVDADVPAVVTTTKLGAYTLGLGYSRFSESEQKAVTTTRLGDLAKDLFIMDNTLAISKDTKAAFSYYLLADYQTANQAKLVHTFGVSGETKIGALGLSGFAAMQAGHHQRQIGAATSKHFHGYAANVAAKVAVGPGALKTGLLYVSGNNNTAPDAQDRGWQSTGIQSYNESGMMILVRNTGNSPTSTDRYLRRVINNVALANLGYDANLTDKVYANANLGGAWAATQGASRGGYYMGTELNLEAGYKVNANLTLRAQAAYAILGPYYKGRTLAADGDAVSPDNPYTARLLASFKF